MVRHIENEFDKLEYAYAFFKEMCAQGIELDEVINSYIGTALFQEHTHFNFLSYQGKSLDGKQFYYSIMEDNSIKTYKTCRDYIEKYGKEILPVCKICPHSHQYANKDHKDELAIIKRINTSYDSLQIFLSESNGTFFKSCMDIAQNTPSPIPYVIPFLRLCFNIIKSYSTGYYEQGILELSDYQRLSMLQNRMYAELKTKYQIDAKIPNCPRIFPLLYSAFVDEISQAEDITDEDMVIRIMHRKATLKQKAASITTKSAAAAFLEYGIEHWTDQFVSNNPISYEKNLLLEDRLQYAFAFSDILPAPPSDIKESRLFTDLSHILSEINLPDQTECNENCTQNISPSPTSHYVENKNLNIPRKYPDTAKTFAEETILEIKQFSTIDIQADDILLFHTEKENLADSLTQIEDNNINIIRKTITNDGDMPCECIMDGNGAYALILWIRPLRRFFYSYFTDLHTDIRKLFTSNSVRKICYQPYYLYSLCKLHGVRIKHVYSIYSIHLLINIGHVINYQKLLELYGIIEPEHHFNDSIPELNDLMDRIPFYRMINRIQAKLIASNEKYSSLKDIALSMDEAIGTSFLRSINFYDDSKLLYIENDQIKFNHCFKKESRRDGFLLTYSIENKNIDRKTKQRIFTDLLCNLSQKGKIRKFNLQLMTMYDDIMILFIARECYEYFTTYIHIHLYEIAQAYEYEKIHVAISHVNCIAKTTHTSNKDTI